MRLAGLVLALWALGAASAARYNKDSKAVLADKYVSTADDYLYQATCDNSKFKKACDYSQFYSALSSDTNLVPVQIDGTVSYFKSKRPSQYVANKLKQYGFKYNAYRSGRYPLSWYKPGWQRVRSSSAVSTTTPVTSRKVFFKPTPSASLEPRRHPAEASAERSRPLSKGWESDSDDERPFSRTARLPPYPSSNGTRHKHDGQRDRHWRKAD